MFRRFLGLDRPKPDSRLPVGDVAPALPDSAGGDGHRPADRRPARGAAARRGPLPRLFRVRHGRAAHADLHISDEETRADGALRGRVRRARRGPGGPRRRDGQVPGAVPWRDRGLRRDPRVPRRSRRRSSGSPFSAAASRSAPRTGRSRPKRRRPSTRSRASWIIETADVNAVRADFHEQLSAVQALRRAGGV